MPTRREKMLRGLCAAWCLGLGLAVLPLFPARAAGPREVGRPKIRPGFVFDAGAILGYQETISYSAHLELAYMFPHEPFGVHVGTTYTFDAQAVTVPLTVSYGILRLMNDRLTPYVYAGDAIIFVLPRTLSTGAVFSGVSFLNPMVGVATKFYLTDQLGVVIDIAGSYAMMRPDVSGPLPEGVDRTASFAAFTLQPRIGLAYRF